MQPLVKASGNIPLIRDSVLFPYYLLSLNFILLNTVWLDTGAGLYV